MDFSEIIKPLSMNEFLSKVNSKESVLMPGDGKRDFNELISLAEIEAALNSGCNISVPAQIIKNGVRTNFVDQNLYWSQLAIKKKEITNLLESDHSFMMANMSQINRAVSELIDTVEKALKHCHADLHLYVSPACDSTGYSAHRDRPQHKIYLQVIGNTSWQIFSIVNNLPDDQIFISEEDEDKCLKQIMDFTMTPGDVLYMPPGQVHKVRNHSGPRVSFSIPFFIDPKESKQRMDRSYIPFRALFEDASRKVND